MEKLVEEFVNKLSEKTQDLIKSKLLIESIIDKFLDDHSNKFIVNEFGNQKEVKESRVIGELNLSEIEFMLIQQALLERIKIQREIIREYKSSLEAIKEMGTRREIENAEELDIKRRNRLSALLEEFDLTSNHVNSLIRSRLKEKIDTVLKDDSSLAKDMYRYNANRVSDWPGYLFRVYDRNKIVIDNKFLFGGD